MRFRLPRSEGSGIRRQRAISDWLILKESQSKSNLKGESHRSFGIGLAIALLIRSKPTHNLMATSSLPTNQPDSSESSISGTSHSFSGQKRTRGPTRNIGLLGLRPRERVKVSFNEYGQLVDEIKGRRLTSYLGTLVRNIHNVPLQVIGWSCVSIEAKEKIWALVLEKFDIAEDRKDFTLSLASGKYRSYRNKMKAAFYNPWPTDEERLRYKPPLVSDSDWKWLVQFWSSEAAQLMSKRNKENRAKQKIHHTSGSKSFAQLRFEQTRVRGDDTKPNRIEMFKLTHTRRDGTPIDDASREVMAQFEEIMVAQTQSQMGESSSSTSLLVDDIYTQVLGPERHGRVRSLGFGATLTSVFGVTKKETNAALASKLKETQEREEKMQQQIQQQGQLQQQQELLQQQQQQQMEIMQQHMQQMQNMMQQMLQFQQRHHDQ